jgi:hypothetical protein
MFSISDNEKPFLETLLILKAIQEQLGVIRGSKAEFQEALVVEMNGVLEHCERGWCKWRVEKIGEISRFQFFTVLADRMTVRSTSKTKDSNCTIQI